MLVLLFLESKTGTMTFLSALTSSGKASNPKEWRRTENEAEMENFCPVLGFKNSLWPGETTWPTKVLATKPDNKFDLITGPLTVEGENQILQVVL